MERRYASVVALATLAVAGALGVSARDDAGVTAAGLADVAAPTGLGTLPDRGRSAGRERDAAAVARAARGSGWVSHGVPRRRLIALTFDDGPGPDTPAVLRVLRARDVPATFFVVGEMARRRPGVLAATARAGHVIADHTERHPYLAGRRRHDQRREIRAVSRLLARRDIPRSRLFRPPYGSFDATTLRVLRRSRLLMVLWSVDAQDYRRPGKGEIVRRVLRGARPGGIVLLHDGGGERGQTVAALPLIITGLRKRGYRLVTVPRLLRDDPPPRRQPRRPRPG